MKLASVLALTVVAALAISGCGNTQGERALSGAGIGAGAGAVGAALVHGNPITGAVVGAGVGAVTGAVTTKKQINLDK